MSFGSSWRLFRRLGGSLGGPWGLSGLSFDVLGALLGALGGYLGSLLTSWGVLGVFLGAPWGSEGLSIAAGNKYL